MFARHTQREEGTPLDLKGNNEKQYNTKITMSEFKAALEITMESIPGPDEITYKITKKTPPFQ